MTTKQGDVALLQNPVAQELLHSVRPARLAYVWADGTPRVIPINFYWNGQELVLHTLATAPKVRALRRNPVVAVTIDTDTLPARVLLVRGTATLTPLAAGDAELVTATERYLGTEGAAAWLDQLDQMAPYTGGAIRIGIRPAWVGILDFQQRFPDATAKAMAALQAGG
jgi:PPOX class probable F420-dependent enzyme